MIVRVVRQPLYPLVFPLIAGAASFTTLLSLRAEYNILNIIIAVALNMIVVLCGIKKVYVVEKVFQQKRYLCDA